MIDQDLQGCGATPFEDLFYKPVNPSTSYGSWACYLWNDNHYRLQHYIAIGFENRKLVYCRNSAGWYFLLWNGQKSKVMFGWM